jgi:outer membrane receptor for ferrienterochelin and colicin
VADLAELGSRRSDQFQTANVNLKPEKSFNLDLGLAYSSSGWEARATGFWLHYLDKIKRFPTGRIVDNQGQFIRDGFATQDADEFIEVSAQNATAMDLIGAAANIEYSGNSEWQGGGTFSYVRGTLIDRDDSTQPVDRIPPANGWFWLSYSGLPDIKLRPQVRYALRHRRISPDEVGDNRVSMDGTDGFIKLQFIAQWQVNQDVSLTVKGDNLTNAAYREHASSLDGLARNVTFTLRLDL